MGSSSQPSTTTTETRQEPWAAAQPHLRHVMSQAQNLYDSDAGRQYYPFSTVVPFSNQTNDALQAQEDLARQGNQLVQPAMSRVQEMMMSGPSAGNDAVANIANGGAGYNATGNIQALAGGQGGPAMGLASQVFGSAAQGGMSNPYQGSIAATGAARNNSAAPLMQMAGQANPTSGFYGNAAAGGMQNQAANPIASMAQQQDPSQGFFQGMTRGDLQNSASYQPFMQPGATPSEQHLSGMASGQSNPHLDGMYDRAAEKVRDQINAQFSGAGRYGSPAHQKLLTEQLGDLANQFYGGQYAGDQARRLQAVGQIQGAYDNSQGRALQATGQQANLNEANIGRQVQGAGQLSNMFGQNFARNTQAADMVNRQNEQNFARQFAGAGALNDQFNQGFGRLAQASALQSQNLNQDLSRQLSAYTQAGNLAEQGFGRQLQSARGLQDLQGQQAQQAMSANQLLGSLSNQNNQGVIQGAQAASGLQRDRDQQALASLSALPGLRQLQFDDASRLAQVGTARERLASEQLQDAMRRWDFQQQQPYNRLAQYNGIINGMGMLGGTGQQIAPQARTNPLMGAAGGAMTGASIGSMVPGIGTAIGAGVGGLLGLLG